MITALKNITYEPHCIYQIDFQKDPKHFILSQISNSDILVSFEKMKASIVYILEKVDHGIYNGTTLYF